MIEITDLKGEFLAPVVIQHQFLHQLQPITNPSPEITSLESWELDFGETSPFMAQQFR
jgi:hypothetical protein